MNKIIIPICIMVVSVLCSCNKTDFSNPKEVIESYRILSESNKNDKIYEEFLSSKSKEYVTKDEFVQARNYPDSILKSFSLFERQISSFPIDVNNPTYRRYKIAETQIFARDTVYRKFYYSLINEDGKWKVIWTESLLAFAKNKYSDGNYSESRKMLDKVLEIDPFSGRAYQHMAWSFYRDQSLDRNERENGIVANAKYAVALEEDNPNHYNTLAAYYSFMGKIDLEIESYERGLSYCRNDSDRELFYSNLGGTYTEIEEYEKAEEYIVKSLLINDKDAFVWLKYGLLMQRQEEHGRAIEHFEKALNETKMEASLQGNLFYFYALSCVEVGKCKLAKEYINRALDVAPQDSEYQGLYDRIQRCETAPQPAASIS